MKKVFFLAMAAIAMLFAGCKENEPSVTNIYYTLAPSSDLIPGELPGKFSVSPTTKIHFSRGNLQYNAVQDIWRFAEHQYDMIGAANANIASDYDGYIDLFGWATSGYNDKHPWMTSVTPSDYGDGTNDLAGTAYDWGVYNAISNGGNESNLWRTLTKDEWVYLFHGRASAQKLFAMGTIDDIRGIILLPDGWILPEGVTFTPSTVNGLSWTGTSYYNYNTGANNFTDNAYTLADWAKMEANGAVFLPAAGYRRGVYMNFVGAYGDYWSISSYSSSEAHDVYCYPIYIRPQDYDERCYAFAVRLVR